MIGRTILTLILLGSIVCGVRAQTTDYVFERMRLPGGIEENRVGRVVQDSLGFLWIRTTAGVFRYDGHSFQKFGIDRFGSARSQGYETIWDIHLDRSGMLWIGTNHHGLHRLDPVTGNLLSYRHDPHDPGSLPSDNVYGVIEDRSGFIWAGTDRGLARLDLATGRFRSYRNDPRDASSISCDAVWVVYEDREGVIWAGTRALDCQGGLNRLDAAQMTFTRYLADPDDETALANPSIWSVFEDSRGRFWVGTEGDGLYTLDRDRGVFTHYPHDPSQPEKLGKPYVSGLPMESVENLPVNSFYEDPSGTLWIGAHTGGINLLNRITNKVTHYEADRDDPASLANNVVIKISGSRDGVIWIGTNSRGGEGLHKAFPASPFRMFKTQSPQGQVFGIVETPNGMLWVATGHAGILGVDSRSGGAPVSGNPNFDDDNLEVGSNWISTLAKSNDGSLWVATADKGIYRLDPRTGQSENFLGDASDRKRYMPEAHAIFQAEGGLVWIGGAEEGLMSFDPKSGETTRYRNDPNDPYSLSNDRILRNGIQQAAGGGLWIRTTGGLDRFDPASGRFIRYFEERSLSSTISGLVEEGDGSLWISWLDSSLTHFDPATGATNDVPTGEAGLPGATIASMLADDLGNLWVLTAETLARFDIKDERFYPYDVSRVGASFNGPAPGVYKNEEGELFFGTVDGVIAFHPEDMIATENRIPPEVVVTRVRIGTAEGDYSIAEIARGEEIRLPQGQDDFSFEFVGLHYLDPKRNRHQYRLDGYDDDWRDAGSERTAHYFKVSPGNYTFRVRAANPYGVWSTKDAAVNIIVMPPWWFSWWAYTLYFAGAGLLFFTGHELRLRRVRKRAETLERLVDERTAELKAEKARTEAQAKRLLELDEVKDRFFFNMSHEFRTPLTLILGPLQDMLAGSDADVTPWVRKKLLTMQTNGRRLHRLISQLLDLSKLEVGRLPLQAKPRDLVQFVRHVVLSFAPSAERAKITLSFRAEVTDLQVFIDADKMEHVITNLLANALKFTSEHGKILVSVTESMDHGTLFAEISVKDTGVGIPADEIPYIFDRFHQADVSRSRSGDGAGIGLSLAQEMVELHGGALSVESEEGFGSTFTIRLRQGSDHLVAAQIVDTFERMSLDQDAEAAWAAEVQQDELTSSENGEPKISTKPSVLIIDDNDDIRDYLREHLEGNYNILDAADGTEGLRKTIEELPDLVLADIMMPGIDGLELCREIRHDERTAHVPVILLTARASPEAEVEGLEAGADDYISKPFNAEALLTRVENLIEIRRLLRERFGDEVTIRPLGVKIESRDALFLDRVKAAVTTHLGDSGFTVEWLADEVGVSTRQLQRNLREIINLSPSGFIRMVRLEHAAELLRSRAGNVSEVADRVGFNDPRYFSRLFKQTFGVSPSSFGPRSETTNPTET